MVTACAVSSHVLLRVLKPFCTSCTSVVWENFTSPCWHCTLWTGNVWRRVALKLAIAAQQRLLYATGHWLRITSAQFTSDPPSFYLFWKKLIRLQRSVSESRCSEKVEVCSPWNEGKRQGVCFRKSGNLNSVSVTMATQSVNLVSLCLRPLTEPETLFYFLIHSVHILRKHMCIHLGG